MTSYHVRFWDTKKISDTARGRYRVRRAVDGREHCKSFATKALADAFLLTLKEAARDGKPFDPATGQPAQPKPAGPPDVTWYEHARAYSQMKWPDLAAKSRRSVFEALTTITLALTGPRRKAPHPDLLRRALFGYAFNAASTSRPVPVERRLLPASPLGQIQWKATEVAETVDRRSVASPAQTARRLLQAVRQQSPRGEHMEAFFGCLYYAALRPSEAVALRAADLVLPDSGWGRIDLAASAPRAGTWWTDDGASRQERGLKHRPPAETRSIPIPPALVELLRNHLKRYGTGPGGRVFRTARGGPLNDTGYGEVWERARRAALTSAQQATPLARRPYDLRTPPCPCGSTSACPPPRSPAAPATASPSCSASTPTASTARSPPPTSATATPSMTTTANERHARKEPGAFLLGGNWSPDRAAGDRVGRAALAPLWGGDMTDAMKDAEPALGRSPGRCEPGRWQPVTREAPANPASAVAGRAAEG